MNLVFGYCCFSFNLVTVPLVFAVSEIILTKEAWVPTFFLGQKESGFDFTHTISTQE